MGTDIAAVFKSGFDLIPLTIKDIDITNSEQAKSVITGHKPDIVINTAAYLNVPGSEKEPEQAFRVNAIAVRDLYRLCRDGNARLIHFSTDYVFDGCKKKPYTEDDVPNPLNTYAISKLVGEFFAALAPKHYIIRVAGLFGLAGCMGKGGTNFIESILEAAKNRPTLQITSNIITSVTYTADAALKLKELISDNKPPGIYHITNSGACTWYEVAHEVFRLKDIKVKLESKEEAEEEAGVRRPLYSVLASKKLTLLRPWQEAIKDYLSKRHIKNT